jgi:hypothetical protein
VKKSGILRRMTVRVFATPQYWYGIPRNVELGGLTMDVDLMMKYQVDESNDYEKFLAYNQAQGARMSAMEHLVPEQMFSTEDNPAHGISAVKALQIAAAEGQKIWTITSANVDLAATNLTLPVDVITEIRNSAAAGMEITAHEQPVDFYGSSQVGYIILDPATGAGAYKIGGGENGGEIIGSFNSANIASVSLGSSSEPLSDIGKIMALFLLKKFSNWNLSPVERINCILGVIYEYEDQLFFGVGALGVLAGGKYLTPPARQFLKKHKLISYLIAIMSLGVVAANSAMCLIGRTR